MYNNQHTISKFFIKNFFKYSNHSTTNNTFYINGKTSYFNNMLNFEKIFSYNSIYTIKEYSKLINFYQKYNITPPSNKYFYEKDIFGKYENFYSTRTVKNLKKITEILPTNNPQIYFFKNLNIYQPFLTMLIFFILKNNKNFKKEYLKLKLFKNFFSTQTFSDLSNLTKTDRNLFLLHLIFSGKETDKISFNFLKKTFIDNYDFCLYLSDSNSQFILGENSFNAFSINSQNSQPQLLFDFDTLFDSQNPKSDLITFNISSSICLVLIKKNISDIDDFISFSNNLKHNSLNKTLVSDSTSSKLPFLSNVHFTLPPFGKNNPNFNNFLKLDVENTNVFGFPFLNPRLPHQNDFFVSYINAITIIKNNKYILADFSKNKQMVDSFYSSHKIATKILNDNLKNTTSKRQKRYISAKKNRLKNNLKDLKKHLRNINKYS